ncbi:SRPBCC family protein [Rhizobium alvei]|uniref:SRPBCC family protein n=1 Tax=Rhizobium alvei TaxID=1132659 RepID=A0ABT8YPT9_9HYPH|nr:SRPBCC family protein [Rhizobium alvei]MDO6965541.1 SRPBCC family protein [Rhizobium alvei]
MRQIDPAPIRKEFVVRAPIARAFSTFFDNMHLWSPKTHTLSGGERGNLFVEPRVGGRWYEIDRNGQECDWGVVLEWDPPHGALMLWQIDSSFRYDPTVRTEVSVRFEEIGGGRTKVTFEHRKLASLGGDTVRTRGILDGDNGWGGALENYKRLIMGDNG